MKVIGINGSPRRNWNTQTLVKKALEGAASMGTETELIDLCTKTFHGCMACFACKRKGNKTHGLCAVRDELTPTLQKLLAADAIIIGSPVYFNFATGTVRQMMERLLFPLDSYLYEDGVRQRILDKVIPAGLIFTMNCPEEWLERYNYPLLLNNNTEELERVLGYAESYFACDTYQFADYSKIDMSLFDEKEKKAHREKQFPIDEQKCFEMGQRLVSKVTELNRQ